MVGGRKTVTKGEFVFLLHMEVLRTISLWYTKDSRLTDRFVMKGVVFNFDLTVNERRL